MGRIKKWFEDLVGIEEEYEDEEEFEEKPVAEAPPAPSLFEKRPLPTPVKAIKKDEPQIKSKVSIVVPVKFEESPEIVTKLKNNEFVIVNYNMMETTEAKKVFHFISGAIYALDAKSTKVSTNIFLYAPNVAKIESEKKAAALMDDTIAKYWTIPGKIK